MSVERGGGVAYPSLVRWGHYGWKGNGSVTTRLARTNYQRREPPRAAFGLGLKEAELAIQNAVVLETGEEGG